LQEPYFLQVSLSWVVIVVVVVVAVIIVEVVVVVAAAAAAVLVVEAAAGARCFSLLVLISGALEGTKGHAFCGSK